MGAALEDSAVRKIFIGRLEPHFTTDLLRDAFSRKFGRVVDVFLANTKRFGFVTFETGSAATAALDAKSLEVDGVTVVTKSATPMKPHGSSDRSDRGGVPVQSSPYGVGYGS